MYSPGMAKREERIEEGQRALVVKGAISSYILQEKLKLMSHLGAEYRAGTLTELKCFGIAGQIVGLEDLAETLDSQIGMMHRERARESGR